MSGKRTPDQLAQGVEAAIRAQLAAAPPARDEALPDLRVRVPRGLPPEAVAAAVGAAVARSRR